MMGFGNQAAATRRLEKVLAHAFETVPFYTQLKDTCSGRNLPYSELPLIGKKRMIDDMDAFMSTSFAGCARTEDARTADRKALIMEFTSGSSGYPLRCYKTVGERTQLAMSLYSKRRATYPDFSNDKMFCFIHNTDYSSHSYMDGLGNLSEQNIGKVLCYLRDEARPRVLHGNTMLLLYYTDYIKKNNFDMGDWTLEFIESVSESISAEQKQHISEQFHTRVTNCYGCLECYNLAYECPHGKLHINENVVIEVVDQQTQAPVTEEGEEGEIVITSLVNRAQPFIRYKTGDIGWVEKSKCACGQESDVVHLTGKRKIDYIKLLYKTDDQRLHICGYDIFSTVMYRIVAEGYDCVSWYNVVQKEIDLFDVLYIKRSGFSEVFFNLFKKYAEEEIGMPVTINFAEKTEEEVLLINKKSRVFRSELQRD